MNKEGVKSGVRAQNQPKQQQVSSQKKKKDAPTGASTRTQFGQSGDDLKGKNRTTEIRRKLSDASNGSEDLSKDSGCASGKLSSSDSSSEISDCSSDNNNNNSRQEAAPGRSCAPATAGLTWAPLSGPGASADGHSCLMELMTGESPEELLREVDDLRSENEYLKDEVEELRCEMLEMRDLFQEEEVFTLQDLRLQLDQANKTCRILQYRLRKAERRSIRAAHNAGQLDGGELLQSLEHDIKVAKSVSLRLYTELEAVKKKNSQLDWDNEALRERTQELEVTKQVLQGELDKRRESTLKRRSTRSSSTKTERRISQQIEDDSADLRCQLHFAKEELALMVKKLTKLVSESEEQREQLSAYRAAYGHMDAAHAPQGQHNSAHAREAEVKVHLKLVEEEATLLSRRIVELEVENRGLRAEMSDMREKVGGGGGGGGGEEEEEEGESLGVVEVKPAADAAPLCAPAEGVITACHVTREGPVGGEWEPAEVIGHEDHGKADVVFRGLSVKDLQVLLALRDQSCVLTSALQLLKSGACAGEAGGSGALQGALALLRDMLPSFTGRLDTILSGDEPGQNLDQAEDLRTSQVKERAAGPDGRGQCDPRLQLSSQILGFLHHWCQVKSSDPEGKEDKERSASVLRALLQELGAQLQEEEPTGPYTGAKATLEGRAQCSVSSAFPDEDLCEVDRIHSPGEKRLRRPFAPRSPKQKNWFYLSQDSAPQEGQDLVKTWDHPIMPLSFPHLDLERVSAGRSHTAPERSTSRIYYSPPSARRVRLAQQNQSLVKDGEESLDTPSSPWCTPSSPWCTPRTSFSQLCAESTANLSDDLKEAARRGRSEETGSGTQTCTRPQMVSVGLQTDQVLVQSPAVARTSPSRLLGSSLLSARQHHISSSLDGVARTRTSTSSPKLYRRHTVASSSSPSLTTSSSSSSSSVSHSRERALWNLNQQSSSGATWTRQSGHRQNTGPGQGSLNGAKPPPKPAAAGANRYGLVTEFLRRVSGRADKPAPGPDNQAKNRAKNLERVPSRTPAASLHRTDSVSRIVNQRFMKQREEAGKVQREERGRGLNYGLRHSVSVSTEDGSSDCSSSSSLTFCFSRPSRCSHRPKPLPHRHTPPGVSAASNCE